MNWDLRFVPPMTLIERLVSWYRKRRMSPNRRIINIWEHTVWGNSIYFIDFDRRRLVGWLPIKPKKGDEVRARMQSGATGRFRVDKVERCTGVDDMFFCDVKDLGHLTPGER